ncbi:MAG: ABC transporter permease [Acidobacteriota bacterium]|jgi:putative ABC transport system permease protein|nr:ABC transporter permease [Acidobacteriota bacterium]
MDNLVFSNFLHRPARTIVSILGISLGVLLIVFTVGLANGSMRERATRESNVNAEIFVRPAGSIGISGSESFRLPVSLAGEFEKIEGVKRAVPFGQQTIEVQDSKTGERLIEGMNFEDYASVVGLSIIEGRKIGDAGDEIIIDTGFQSQKNFKVGDKMKVWQRDFTIVGTYEPAAGSRVKIPLLTMQKQVGGEGKATAVLVKVKNGANPETVATAINQKFPDTQIIFTKDLEELYMSAIPALGIFLNVIIGVAAIISALVILLTMYTTVTERTRQIGIMKSLGMANSEIAWIITKEAILISFCGIILGIILTIALRFLLTSVTTLEVELSPTVIAITTVVGLLGGAVGGLYPALRAAKLDAVEALSYE